MWGTKKKKQEKKEQQLIQQLPKQRMGLIVKQPLPSMFLGGPTLYVQPSLQTGDRKKARGPVKDRENNDPMFEGQGVFASSSFNSGLYMRFVHIYIYIYIYIHIYIYIPTRHVLPGKWI